MRHSVVLVEGNPVDGPLELLARVEARHHIADLVGAHLFGGLGTFRVSVSSEGAEMLESVTTRSITDVRILFQPGKRFRRLINSTEFEKIQG